MRNVGEIEKEKCSGCYACYNVCCKNAIIMSVDHEGFWYPQIDTTKCTNCGMCLSVCPTMNTFKKNKYEHAYACYAKNKMDHVESSSGGIFITLAKKVLAEGGSVFGAAFNDCLEVEHVQIKSIAELNKVQGTKYVQSRIGTSYTRVRNELEKGEIVLFSGTPCQIAGLKVFLGKEYEKLLCVDLICHGVPSPKVWKCYLEETFGEDEVIAMQFRNKFSGVSKATLKYWLKSGVVFSEAYEQSLYIKGFISNFYTRPSCFKCQNKGDYRCSDITIGDFWSIKEFHPEMTNKYGVSAVIARTEKGEQWMKASSADLVMCNAKTKEIAVWNSSLNESAKETRYRALFYKQWEENKISDLIQELVLEKQETENKKTIKNGFVKYVIKKIKGT